MRSGITGVLGGSWRADVTAWGAVVPWDGSPVLDWRVAAEDRWHSPASEVTVRQERPLGAPVFETRLRVPGGDVVHRVWSVADAGGCTVVEVENDSALPVACAFTRRDLLTSRPPSAVPPGGTDLDPATTLVLPISHRTSVRVAIAHDGRPGGPLPASLSPAAETARGWVALTERASRLVVPGRDAADVVAGRSLVLLAGPPPEDDDPVEHLLAVGELARMGELDAGALEAAVPAAVAAAEAVARADGWDVDAALAAAAVVLEMAGEDRAVRDLASIVARRPGPAPSPAGRPDTGGRAVAAAERRLARGAVLLPDGIPAAWRGSAFEAHGLRAGPATTLSFAVRWHGDHPAVLWQVDGAPAELTAPAVDPGWRTRDPSGEALWRPGR